MNKPSQIWVTTDSQPTAGFQYEIGVALRKMGYDVDPNDADANGKYWVSEDNGATWQCSFLYMPENIW